MKNLRLFTAIPLPTKVINDLKLTIENISQTNIKMRKTLPQNLHITLCFLGNKKEKEIPQINQILTQISHQTKTFILILEKIVFFPSTHKPHMIWAKFKENKEYENLVKKIFKKTSTNSNNKNILPHITLARIKQKGPINISLPNLQIHPITVSSFNLVSSQLTSDGPIYNIMSSFKLRKDEK